MAEAIQINPHMLSWARETAGLSLEEAAEKLGLKSSAKASGADKLRSLEEGRGAVSQTQLQKAASAYRRPLISFYLPQPPERGDRGEDFRTVSGAVSSRDNALLDALMRDIRARQQMLREVLLDQDEAILLAFVGSSRLRDGANTVAASIRSTLGVSKEQQKNARGPSDLFRLLRAASEQVGVYVLLLGDVGSHHSDIGEEVFRGFALADDIAPFIVINDNDATTARTFTLLHELAHIWIGASGVSGPLVAVPADAVERFCNSVADEFLLPREEFNELSYLRWDDVESALEATERLAKLWNISQGVVAYRLASDGQISADVASNLFRIFTHRWKNEKTRVQKDNAGAPSYYIVRRFRLGGALLDVVRRAIHVEALTHTKAAKILGVSPSSVDKLLQERIRAA